MYLVSIRFVGAFPEGDRIVDLALPNGGGSSYHLSVGNFYWGVLAEYTTGWRVMLQVPNSDYAAGDLQVLIDLVIGD